MEKTRMRIVFLSHLDTNLYLFRLPVMKEMVLRGHEVIALCPKGVYFDQFEDHGIKAVSYNINRGSLNPFSELITLWNIANILKVLRPDLLHCFTIKPNLCIAAKWAGIPRVILSVTGMGSFYIDPSYKSKLIKTIIELLYRIVCRISSKTLFQNHDDLNYFVNQAICPKDKAVLIRSSGVDTDYFHPENTHLASNAMLVKSMELENKTIVIMIARAIWHKGIREYYDAAKILQTQAPHIKMILVGGTDKGNLSCADETFLQNKAVLWLGEQRDIKELIAVSDIVVLPSYR
jgi:N,N'-diacetylbacillosaminyl-diphospho-undecaprenol alpha-1,3-N-acetylgalactosaminyltransferase